MSLPKFVDCYAKPDPYSLYGHLVTNESLACHNRLLDRAFPSKVERGGGIASGGEVALFCLLPRCKEVVVIDHSYRAILSFYLKCLFLREYGKDVFKSALSSKADFAAAAKKVWKDVPEVLTKIPRADVYGAIPAGSPGVIDPHDNRIWDSFASYGLVEDEFRKYWAGFTENQLIDASNRMKNLTILHGDLVAELPAYGKFDILYTSNATEHANRDGKYPNLDELSDLLADGGAILNTRYGVSPRNATKYDIVEQEHPSTGTWTHYIHRLKKEAA